MRTSLRYLLPLTVLVAAPLLGAGGRAHAGYQAPASVVLHVNADTLFSDPTPQVEAMGSTSGDIGGEAEGDSNNGSDLRPSPLPVYPRGLDFAASPSFDGAGCPSPSGDTDTEVIGQTPLVASAPRIDAPALVGVLFLQTTADQPPPFPSRLFRPPRLS